MSAINPHPIGTFARLVFARASRGFAPPIPTRVDPGPRPLVNKPWMDPKDPRVEVCNGSCAHPRDWVWAALDAAYPAYPLQGPQHRQELAALFAPIMAVKGWRFCECYRGKGAEFRFIARLVDTEAANVRAETLLEAALCMLRP